MKPLLVYAEKHWPAWLVLGFMIWRMTKADSTSDITLWTAVGLGFAGVTLNLVVILANGKMPVAAKPEEIGEDDHAHYRPIDESTRLGCLADWIPLGTLMISPGDVLLMLSVGILLIRAILGVVS